MARNSRTHGLNGRLMGGRVALASAVLATFVTLGGTAFADELTTDSIQQAPESIVLEAPTDWAAPTLFKREREQRGNDDGAHHARKGADDGAGNDRGKDVRVGRHGADDGAGDDRGKDVRVGRHGADDGAGDDRGKDVRVGRHGADDQPGDDRGGHGKDDGANHA